MNAQFPITTTPKYNFPSSKNQLYLQQLPKHFIELSLQSIEKTENQITHYHKITNSSPSRNHQHSLPKTELVHLTPEKTAKPIVAIDVSSIKLGETRTGTLLGVRGAIVWKEENHYKYLRIGPFPFHITQQIENEIRSILNQTNQNFPQKYVIPQTYFIQNKLTSILERWIQSSIIQTTYNSIVLWDGSLIAGTTESPIKAIKELLTTAQKNRNTILAFSKMTRLTLQGHKLTDLIFKHQPPCLLKIQENIDNIGPMKLMGDIYIAKFTKGNLAFRMDADKHSSKKEIIDAVQNLLGNDVILQSYPETLRLAHIFSTFTATEVLGLQRYISLKSDLRIEIKPNLRRLLFGRFGKGPEG